MTSLLILQSLATHLRPLIEAQGGTLDLSGSPEDTMAKLSLAPQRWRVLLQWQRESRIGTTKALRGTFAIVVQQAQGLPMAKNSDLLGDRANDPGLLERTHQVIQWVMAARPSHPAIDCHSWDFPEAIYHLTDPEASLPARQIVAEFAAMYGIATLPKETLAL